MNGLDGLVGPAFPLYSDPFGFTWNLQQGARRWRDALGRVRDAFPLGSATQYGADVVVIGDSTGTYGNIYESWPHLLKVMLQERFNRSGIQGGFGLMPFETQNSTANDWTFVNGSGTWDKAHNNVTRMGTGLFEAKINPPSANNKIWRYFDPTTAYGAFQRQGVTDWQYVGLSYSGVANSIYCDSATTNGALAPATVVAGGGGSTWGFHWTAQSGLTITQHYTLQIATKATTDQAWANGVILYGGDFNEGVRLHNLSSVGSASDAWWNSNDTAAQLPANIGNFCAGGNGGAVNCKLLLINTMLNDCGISSQNLPVATYRSNLQGVISYALSQTTLPCVGLIVNPPWDLGVSNATQVGAYAGYRDAAYQLAASNDNVFVIDFWRVLTDATHPQYGPHGGNVGGGAMHDRGWYNDGIHGNGPCNAARARMLFAALSYGA
ncbi:MAG: hypothetical protein ACHQ50_01805 [Fimbriimonadales bacterium]